MFYLILLFSQIFQFYLLLFVSFCMWNFLLLCKYTLFAPDGKKIPNRFCDLDLSYMSLQTNVDTLHKSKFAFFPTVFKDSFEFDLIPFKWLTLMFLLSPRQALIGRKQPSLSSPLGQLYILFLVSGAWEEAGRRAYRKEDAACSKNIAHFNFLRLLASHQNIRESK